MEYYREGFLNKAGKGLIQTHLHSWRPRYFVLDGVTLKYYKCREVAEENMLGCINVSQMESISAMKNEKNAFQITTKAKRTYYMSGRSQDEIQGWLKCLAMAKAKHLEKQNFPVLDPGAPTKPPRSPTSVDHSDTSPTSSGSSTSPTQVPSAYQFVQFPVKDDKSSTKPEPDLDKDDGLYADPTYDTINEKDVPKNVKSSAEDVDPATDLYDVVETTTTKKSPKKGMVRASDPCPQSTVPPPLPARFPSMPDKQMNTKQEKKEVNGKPETQAKRGTIGLYRDFSIPDSAASINSGGKEQQTDKFGFYDEVSNPGVNAAGKTDLESQKSKPDGNITCGSVYDEVGGTVTNSGSENATSKEDNTFGLYDEVNVPDSTPVSNSGSETPQPEANGVGSYDDVTDNKPTADFKKKLESNVTPFVPDPSHVYAQPQKSSSLRRDRSKKKLIPGLMDVGEVSVDIEEEAAGGRETLQRGMTKPQGDRFAIEELKDILAEYDEKNNNNNQGERLDDFDINQCASAFEALRRFLERCE